MAQHTQTAVDQAVDQELYNTPKANVVWDDFDFSVSNLIVRKNTSKPDFDDDEGEYLFDKDEIETVVGSKITLHRFQIELKPGENELLWKPHIHWFQEATGNVKWQLEYKINRAAGPEGTWQTLDTTVLEFPYTSGTIHQISVFPTINMTDMLNTAVHVKVKISRLATDPTDTYDRDARLLGFDFHVPIDQSGSREEYIK